MLAVSAATGLATTTAVLAVSFAIVSHLIVIIFIKKKNILNILTIQLCTFYMN